MNEHGKSSNRNKTVRALVNKARKDDINALFQLAQYYENGQYVEKDIEQAKVYFDRVLELFKSQSLKISSLKLIDFRAFKNAEVNFSNEYNSNLTVIVGNNGAGKTALLESIEKSLSWIHRKIVSQGGTGDPIDQLDINNDVTAEYTSIIANFSISEKNHYKLELAKSKKGSKFTKKGQYGEIANLAGIYKLANSKNTQFNFPIMASYFVERALEIREKDTEKFDEIPGKKYWSKFEGYQKALNGAANFQLFFRWFKYFEDVDNASGKKSLGLIDKMTKLKNELNMINAMLKEAILKGEGEGVLNSFKQEKQKAIQKLEAEMGEKKKEQPNRVIDSVTKAIYKFLPNFNNMRIQRSSSLDMLIDKNNVTLNVLQLSQGEKSLLALVGDIARRLVLLNPSLDDPLDGDGIVLIDEVDLHLHPEWQQSVIPNLLKTFPNIQFIMTTHSPQVLTTVHHSCIRILSTKDILKTSVSTLGEESRTTLEDVMHVDSRPKDQKAQKLKEYLERINRGNINSDGIKLLRVELEKHYGKSNSQFRLADLTINRWLAVHKNKDD